MSTSCNENYKRWLRVIRDLREEVPELQVPELAYPMHFGVDLAHPLARWSWCGVQTQWHHMGHHAFVTGIIIAAT